MRQHIGLGFVVAAALLFAGWLLLRPNPEGNALRVRALATRGLAEYLAVKEAGQRAMVMGNPFTQMPGADRDARLAEDAGLRGLRQGFGTAVRISTVAFPAVQPEAQYDPRSLLGGIETSTPLSYLVTSNAFDAAVKSAGNPTLVVSLIGLPAELEGCAAWTAPGPPRFALLWPDLRVIGDAAVVRKALKSGKLAAFVLRRPGAPDDSVPLGRDAKVEFERRFVLVTAENMEQIAQQQPELY